MAAVTTIVLIKESALYPDKIQTHYIDELVNQGIPAEEIQTLPLLYTNHAKVTAKTAKAYLDKLIHRIPNTVTRLVIADSQYFKTTTKASKVTKFYGTTVQGAYPGYENFQCAYVPNYNSLFKNPDNQDIITAGLQAAAGNGNQALIHTEVYGMTYGSDREILDSLYQHPVLAADIETDGLGLDCKIVSIALAWSKHDGCAIDLRVTGTYHLKKFLENYKGKLIFHGALFDAKILTASLWMEHGQDFAGLLQGLYYFRDVDCTMIMGYLEKNSTTKPSLSLKDLALEYVGNYAIEIEDVTKYTAQEILHYNLVDALGTFYLWEKYQHQLQSRPWKEIFGPSIYPILKMMLVGLPMNSERVREVNSILSAKEEVLNQTIQMNPHVQRYNEILQKETCEKANAKLKKLVKTVDQFADVKFNPNSHQQLGALLFDMLGLPVLELTKTKAPSVGGEVLESLIHHTDDDHTIELLEAVVERADVVKINGTFISAFMEEEDFLHGNIKLGGTQSGRCSSNSPNLQNLPSHGPMGKLVKSCIEAPDGVTKIDGEGIYRSFRRKIFKDPEMYNLIADLIDLAPECPTRRYDYQMLLIKEHPEFEEWMLPEITQWVERDPGWLFAGADFASLEERIGAILANDPERIKCYTDGFDGHSMRSFRYFSDQMPDITESLAKAETATEFWIDEKGEYHCA